MTQVKVRRSLSLLAWLSREEPASRLRSLTPTYLKDQHGFYVEELCAAIRNPSIRNIALSGGYGVGKSSILKRIAELNSRNAIELSFSTLAPILPTEDGVPLQATTPTNQIQQEIVKQLLYREAPEKTPGSRFRRIERFSWMRETILSVVLGATFSAALLLSGWTAKISAAFPRLDVNTPWDHLFSFFAGAFVFLLLRRAYYGRIDVKQVTAGAATVTLDEKSVSYFDQYLDEIVYFFEVSKTKIVIFEDIDRFNDAHIFETLRSLNSLLNASRQIKGPIKFIYAVRDSIFDREDLERQGRTFVRDTIAANGSNYAEVLRANRTKFFDLVIPVVPFITHQSARNLAHSVLRDTEHLIDVELIDLASRYVAEMRLLTNTRNEFVVFRDRLFSGDGKGLRLGESELFAMMLYKATYLADFENIRFGSSKLDVLYEKGRQMVAANIARLEAEIRESKSRRASRAGAERKAQLFGDQLIKHIKSVARAIGAPYAQGAFSFNGNSLVESNLREASFWLGVAGSTGGVLQLTVRNNHGYGPAYAMNFAKSDFEEILGKINPDEWESEESKGSLESEAKKLSEIRWFKAASIRDLIAATGHAVTGVSGDESLDAFAQSLLGKSLAYDLVRSGYINNNFALYTATFHGYRVSPEATNFIIHNLERGVRDENYPLTKSDVEALVRERSSQIGEPVLYNIDFLDQILQSPKLQLAAEKMIAAIAKMGDEERSFLVAYLNRGSQRLELIRRIASQSPRMLSYLTEEPQLDLELKCDLFNAAISSIPASTKLVASKSVADFIAVNYKSFAVLLEEAADSQALQSAVGVVESLDVRVGALLPLSSKARSFFVAKNLYAISEENLRIALGDDVGLSLDLIRDVNEIVFEYSVNRLGDYLGCIEGLAPSILSRSAFAPIVSMLSGVEPDLMARLIEMSSDDCVLDDVLSIPKNVWPVVAIQRRVKASFHNVRHYLEESGSVDQPLAQMLKRAEALSDSASAEEDDKVDVAIAILVAGDVLSPGERALLCKSLEMENYIDASLIRPEEGDLFGLLIGSAEVFEDASETYAALAELSWDTKERYIKHSAGFKDYASPDLIGGDLADLLLSEAISIEVKERVVRNASEYASNADNRALLALGAVAAARAIKLELPLLERVVSAGTEANVALQLLVPHLGESSEPQVSGILRLLGDEYAALTLAGKDRPKVKSSMEISQVLEFLSRQGVVTSYVEDGDSIRVSKRHA